MYSEKTGYWSFTQPDGRVSLIGMMYREDTNDWNTIQSIIENDEYLARKIPCVNDKETTFIDIGSHVGSWARLMQVMYPYAQIVAVEALEENYRLMKENIHAGAYLLHRAAAEEDDKILHLSYGDIDGGHHRFIANNSGTTNSSSGVDVATISLNTLCNPYDKIRVLKLDCEGGEYNILRGASHSTLRKIDYILGEHHYFSPTYQGRDDLYQIVKHQFRDVTKKSGLPLSDIPIGEFMFKNRDLTDKYP